MGGLHLTDAVSDGRAWRKDGGEAGGGKREQRWLLYTVA